MDPLANSEVVQVLINITNELRVIWPLIMTLTAFIGFVFVVASVFLAINSQYTMMMRSALAGLPNKTSLILFFSGILLLHVPGFLFHVSDTVFKNSALSILSYQTLNTGVNRTGSLGVYLDFFVAVVMTVGLFSMLKGLIGYAIQGGSAQALGPTLAHIGVGSICANINLFMPHLGETFGGAFQSNIDKFF